MYMTKKPALGGLGILVHSKMMMCQSEEMLDRDLKVLN